ncbi:MAG: DNA methyltransferase [Thermoleophilaceae bacterium]
MLVRPDDAAKRPEPRHTESVNGWVPLDDEQLPRLQFETDLEDQRLTHQLIRFPAKFHAPVIRRLIDQYTNPGDRLLDSFCGSGTLLVEASISGRHAIGFDVDPLAVFIANTKSRPVDVDALRAVSNDLLEHLQTLRRPADEYHERMQLDADLDDREFATESSGLELPGIPRLEYWFRRYVIVDLARLRDAIDALDVDEAVREVLRLVFASIIRGTSNADPVPVSGLERTKYIRQRDEDGRLIDPFVQFERKLRRALADVDAYQKRRIVTSVCRAEEADATASLPIGDDEPVHAAISSPPYHGAVDYYRRHQLEMFWLGLTETQADRLTLLDRYLGRPHVPQKHRFVLNTELSMWPGAAACEAEMRDQAPRRADEFRHYCVGMSRAFARLAEALPTGAPAIFIVGRSHWNGASLDTSALLAELAHGIFELDEELWYPVKNRHMSYGRKNGANIDREYVLVFRRTGSSPTLQG